MVDGPEATNGFPENTLAEEHQRQLLDLMQQMSSTQSTQSEMGGMLASAVKQLVQIVGDLQARVETLEKGQA